MVRRDGAGARHLGRQLLARSAGVTSRASEIDRTALVQPHREHVAAELGGAFRLSVLGHAGILLLAGPDGRRTCALTLAPGHCMPLRAGAASKLLLAHIAEPDPARWLARPVAAFTPRTIADAKRLRAEPARIRRQGRAQDKGKNAPGIPAFAAPVSARDGRMIAALSIPFLAGT